MGDAPRALKVLDRMEATLVTNTDHPSPSRSNVSLPRPDVIMYISLMTGFAMSQNLQAAEEIDRRLRKVYTYVPGEHASLDAVYEKLQRLRVKLGKLVCSSVFRL